MQVDTQVLAHDMRYFAIAYALAIGAAFLPLEPVWLKWIVAVVLIGIYAWYVKGHFEADPDVDAGGPRAAAVPSARPRRRIGSTRPCRGSASSTSRSLAALGLIVLGAIFFVDAVEHLRARVRRRRRAPRARHRPDRDRAAREVQLDHLGPRRQGHPGDGQHHRRDGLPVDDPDGRRPRLRADTWVVEPGSYVAFASAGIAFLSIGG